jgi:hypothetical protein
VKKGQNEGAVQGFDLAAYLEQIIQLLIILCSKEIYSINMMSKESHCYICNAYHVNTLAFEPFLAVSTFDEKDSRISINNSQKSNVALLLF